MRSAARQRRDRRAGSAARLLRSFAFLALAPALLAAADVVFYLRYVRRLGIGARTHTWEGGPRLYGDVQAELLNSLGHLPEHPGPTHPSRFQTVKPTGTIRIGAFGASMTMGHAVDPGLDFPSILARTFRRNGFRNVEVLNFGAAGLTFHGAARLWERYGRAYGLDFVVVGPAMIGGGLDPTFNSDRLWGHVHGRYILRGDEALFVDPVGGPDLRRRLKAYFAFIPPWRYLRYDAAAPAFIQCLRPDRPYANPFYYRRGGPDPGEAARLYEILLGRMVRAGSQVVLVTPPDLVTEGSPDPRPYVPTVLAAVERAYPRDVVASQAPVPRVFPYRRDGHHYSGFGARLLARELFDLLTGKGETRATVLEFRALPGSPAPRIPLERFSRADVRLGGITAGALIEGLPLKSPEAINTPADFRRGRVRSLFALKGEASGPLDLLYLTLDFEVKPGDRAQLHWRKPGTAEGVSDLGEARFLGPQLPIAYVPAPGAERASVYGGSELLIRPGLAATPRFFEAAPAAKAPDARAWITLAGRTIYTLERMRDRLEFRPASGAHVYANPLSNTDGDLDQLPRTGTVELVLRGSSTVRVPFARWVRRDWIVRHPRPGPRSRIVLSRVDPRRKATALIDGMRQ